MILPLFSHPKHSVYYCSYLILDAILQENRLVKFSDLYLICVSKHQLQFPIFVLSLDWLYLLGKISINEKMEVKLCL